MYEDEDSKKYARYNLHYRILSPKIEGFVFFFLLRLAVSYRFAYDHYSGNGSGGSVDVKEIADGEEFRMIKEIW